MLIHFLAIERSIGIKDINSDFYFLNSISFVQVLEVLSCIHTHTHTAHTFVFNRDFSRCMDNLFRPTQSCCKK